MNDDILLVEIDAGADILLVEEPENLTVVEIGVQGPIGPEGPTGSAPVGWNLNTVIGAITGSVNNWEPTGLEGAAYIKVTSTADPAVITGLSSAFASVGSTIVVIDNMGDLGVILMHESASSTALNRFAMMDSQNLYLGKYERAVFLYTGTSGLGNSIRWRQFIPNRPLGPYDSAVFRDLTLQDMAGGPNFSAAIFNSVGVLSRAQYFMYADGSGPTYAIHQTMLGDGADTDLAQHVVNGKSGSGLLITSGALNPIGGLFSGEDLGAAAGVVLDSYSDAAPLAMRAGSLGIAWLLIDPATGAITGSGFGDVVAYSAADFDPAGAAAPHLVDGVSTATPTPDVGTDGFPRIYELSALAVDAAFQMPTGTPVNGQKLMLRIKAAGAARALTWPAGIVAHGAPLPAIAPADKWLRVGLDYVASDLVWGCIASAQEA